MNPKLLIMCLEGPLQSWGLRARWDIRDTGREPTKSGIIGLLGCALGYSRGDKRLEDELGVNLKVGVREEVIADQMEDFHTVMGAFPKADGAKFKEGHTIITLRSYLEDGAFVVVISGPEKLLEKCQKSLLNPKWPIFLGRKSCPPTRPVFEDYTDKYSSIEDALSNYPWNPQNKPKKSPESLRCIIEDEKGNLIREDEVKINPARMYGRRKVSEFWVSNPSL